jgi:hypothetical protein
MRRNASPWQGRPDTDPAYPDRVTSDEDIHPHDSLIRVRGERWETQASWRSRRKRERRRTCSTLSDRFEKTPPRAANRTEQKIARECEAERRAWHLLNVIRGTDPDRYGSRVAPNPVFRGGVGLRPRSRLMAMNGSVPGPRICRFETTTADLRTWHDGSFIIVQFGTTRPPTRLGPRSRTSSR